ncbi:YciI family protein [Ruegeria sp. MALMAid1280]|uniref:YciI family protein n=1 Tax=Ruegeria sp. MALMAid1280 TaxID=3411634 RepID=UPI003B9DD69B
MFLITLKFAHNKAAAKDSMPGHNEWIQQGMSDGVFLVVGSLQPQQGGAILAFAEDRADIEARVAKDPFVKEGVVAADVLEIIPNRADPRLTFLLPTVKQGTS